MKYDQLKEGAAVRHRGADYKVDQINRYFMVLKDNRGSDVVVAANDLCAVEDMTCTDGQ